MDTVRTPSDIGNVIRARRKHLGWDQARLAKQIGVSRQWIVDIEKGKPRAELQLILRALHVLGLQLALSPGAAQAQEREMLDPIPAASINLDAILERHRGTLPPGTGCCSSIQQRHPQVVLRPVATSIQDRVLDYRYIPEAASSTRGLEKAVFGAR